MPIFVNEVVIPETIDGEETENSDGTDVEEEGLEGKV